MSSSRAQAATIAAVMANADTMIPDFEVVEEQPDEITIDGTDYLAVAQIPLFMRLFAVVTPKVKASNEEPSHLFFVEYVEDAAGKWVHVTDDDILEQLKERAEAILKYFEQISTPN